MIFFNLPKYYQGYNSNVFYISLLITKLNKQFMNHMGKSPQRPLSLKCVSTSMTQEIGGEEWKLSVLLLSLIHFDLGATKNIPS